MSDLSMRPVRWIDDVVDAGDLEAAAAVYDAFERDRLGRVETGRDELVGAYALPHVAREETVLLLDEGEVAGCVWVNVTPEARQVYADVAVRPGPGERDRLDACLRHVLAASRRIAASSSEPGWKLHAGCAVQDSAFTAVLEQHGLVPVRRFYRMRITSDSPLIPAEAPPLPSGVELVVRDDEATRRTVWEVHMESFVDHWNFTPKSWEDWWASMDAGDTRDPEGWWLLTVDGEPAAICLSDNCRVEFGEGYVGLLGVRKQFRGRGLASLLLQRAFVRDRALGRIATQLDVDAENTTGAVGVYERVGMKPLHVFQGFALELA